MLIRNAYSKRLCFFSNDPIEGLDDYFPGLLQSAGSGTDLVVVLDPPFLDVFAPRGEIRIRVTAGSDRQELRCVVTPYLFKHSSAILFTIVTVLAWALAFWLFKPGILFLTLFVCYWLISCFVAIYMGVFLVAAATFFLFYSGTPVSIAYLLAAWIISLLIVHLTYAFNRRALVRYLLRHLKPSGARPC